MVGCPATDLCLCQVERVAELGALCDAEVLFLAELLLQAQQLLRSERRPRFAVGLVLAEVTLQLGRLAVVRV